MPWKCIPGRNLARSLAGLLVVGAAIAPGPAVYAGGGPENVFLVVNSASWASQAVANQFVRLREIPPSNVFYIAWDGGFEELEIQEFRSRLLGPVLKSIDDRGLTDQIDYVVYSSDFPYAINAKSDFQGQKLPPQLTPVGSINSLTYLWQSVMSKSPNLLNLHSNQYMRAAKDRTVRAPVHGFRAWYGWGSDGELLEAGGARYMLSTMLAVTSGRGNSVPEAIDYLRRSTKSDGTWPTGSIYYMKSEDVRTTTRADTFRRSDCRFAKAGGQSDCRAGQSSGRPVRRAGSDGGCLGL